MPFTKVHPADAWRPHRMTRDEFGVAIDEACRNYYGVDSSNRLKLYDNTRMLAILWEGDQFSGLGIGNQAARVANVFEQSYQYSVETLVLAVQDPTPEATLADTLHRMLDGLKEDDLAIVYYVGHGERALHPPDGLQYLKLATGPELNRPFQSVDFQKLRSQIIDPCRADVLILLDCCGATGGAIGHRKELIAASAFDETTHTGPASFTSILVQQLQHAIDNRHILSTAQLYNRMATKHLVRVGGVPELNAMPYFLQNSGEGRTPIMLAPNFIHDTWTPGPVMATYKQPVNVVLHVHLADANAEMLSEMKHWLLHSRPHNIRRIEIKSVFPSTSVVLTILATLDVWYTLPDNPAISFVGFEQNRHMPVLEPITVPMDPPKSTVCFGKGPIVPLFGSSEKENQPPQ